MRSPRWPVGARAKRRGSACGCVWLFCVLATQLLLLGWLAWQLRRCSDGSGAIEVAAQHAVDHALPLAPLPISRARKALMQADQRQEQQMRSPPAGTQGAGGQAAASAVPVALTVQRVAAQQLGGSSVQQQGLLGMAQPQVQQPGQPVERPLPAGPRRISRAPFMLRQPQQLPGSLLAADGNWTAAKGIALAAALLPDAVDHDALLQQYQASVLDSWTPDWHEALRRQQRPGAGAVGIPLPVNVLPPGDLSSIPARLDALNEQLDQAWRSAPCSVAIHTTWGGDAQGLQAELLPWMTYHAALGVSGFVLVYDGTCNATARLLSRVRGARISFTRPPLASPGELAAVAEHLRADGTWEHRPGAFQLMTKQGYGLTLALQLARAAGHRWLLHLDADELMHPGSPGFSLAADLCGQPDAVPAVNFVNCEAQPEAGELTSRFEQVSLFRTNKHMHGLAAVPWRYTLKQGHNAAWLNLYTNGKSAVRVDAPGARHAGPHLFTGSPSDRYRTPDNPAGAFITVISQDQLVLHYAYSTLQDVAQRAARSNCSPQQLHKAADTGDPTQVAGCFVIDVDRRAALVAASGNSTAIADFYWGELVLSEGAPVQCARRTGGPSPQGGQQVGWCSLHDVAGLKALLTRAGLLVRLNAAQQLVRAQEQALRARLAAGKKGRNDV